MSLRSRSPGVLQRYRAAGSLALPGSYQVKLTADGQSRTQPLELRLDPRVTNVSAADLQKEFDLGMKIREANNRLHVAVNQIRQLRGELETLRQWAGDSPQAQPVLAAARQFGEKMTPIEEELMQVKMKSSEGNLGLPNKLNEALDSLSHTEDTADSAPPRRCTRFRLAQPQARGATGEMAGDPQQGSARA